MPQNQFPALALKQLIHLVRRDPCLLDEMASELALPTKSRAVLKEIADQLAVLKDRQTEIGALQQKLDSDRKAVATLSAEVQQRNAALDARDVALSARAARPQAVADQFEQRLAAHAATLESTIS